MNAAMYLRKSRADDPHETVESTLQRHETSLRQFAQSNAIVISAVYREVVSGDRLDVRREMRRLLADCSDKSFDCVLCMDIDRLGRGSMAEQGIILDTFKAASVKIVTPRKVYDLHNELDETYSEFESFMARQELKIIKRRLQRGIQRSAEEGSFLSLPPYGYQRATILRHPSLVPIPAEAEAVRLIFNWYTQEGLGCQSIAECLNSMGYLPRRATGFGRTTVLDILANPVYCGRVRRETADGVFETTGLHEALVSEEVFRAAAAIRTARAHPPTAKRKLQNPLAGLVYCGICGQKMQRLPRTATRRQESLVCPQAGCNVGTALSFVEQAVIRALLPQLPQSINPPNSIAVHHPVTTVRQQQLEEQRMRLYQLVELGIYTPEEYTCRRTTLDNQQAALQPSVINTATPPSIDTADAYARADTAARNAFLRLFVDKILYAKSPHASPKAFSLDIYLK